MRKFKMHLVIGATIITLIASAGSIASAHDGHAPNAKAKIIAPAVAITIQPDLDTQFRNALAAGNARSAAALLSDDVRIYEGGGVERSKAEYVGHNLGADIAFSQATQFSVTQRNVRMFGDMAIATSESRTTGQYRERAINLLGTETMIMRRERGQWRIIHIHWSSKNAPVAPRQN